MKSHHLAQLWLRCRERTSQHGREEDRGQGMVEYALILMLIAIVVIAILLVVGKQVNNYYSNISSGLST